MKPTTRTELVAAIEMLTDEELENYELLFVEKKRKRNFHVLDFHNNSIGPRRERLDDAVKDYNLKLSGAKLLSTPEWHYAVAEIVYPKSDNGLTAYASLQKKISDPFQ